VAAAVFFVKLTGLRFVLFPPLVVIGFEMFGHTAICPWAKQPLLLPVACFLTAAGGLLFWRLLGVGPAAAACSMAWGILVLRGFDLHVPPAMAVFSDGLAEHRLSDLGRYRDAHDDALFSFVPISRATASRESLMAEPTSSADRRARRSQQCEGPWTHWPPE
jgi:hypothetical protein